MEALRSPKKSTYDIAECASVLFVLILLIVVLGGCADVTVTRLADRCYAASGKASVSFSGDTGKVDCK